MAPAKKTTAKKESKSTPTKKTAAKKAGKPSVKIARKLLAEGKLPEGHIRRLGVKRQTLPKAKSRPIDLARDAMLAGYRVSQNGKIYYEARANRSDTPKERDEYSLVKKRTRKASPISHKVGKSKQPDRYQPPRYPKQRKPRYRIMPIITPTGNVMKDNYLTKIAIGHWYDSVYEYQVLQAADGTAKGYWFLWQRHLPDTKSLEKCEYEWRVYDYIAMSQLDTSFEESIKAAERILGISYKMYSRKRGDTVKHLQMTEGLYNYIDRRHKGKYDNTINDKKVVPIIMEYEKRIHDLPPKRRENAIAFDNLGNVLYHGVGTAGSCNAPHYISRIAAYYTHNHPYEHKTPCGFSEGDIDWSATFSSYNLHMIRACGYGRWWSLLSPHGDAPSGYRRGINEAFAEAGKRGEDEAGRFAAANEYVESTLSAYFGDKFKAGDLK